MHRAQPNSLRITGVEMNTNPLHSQNLNRLESEDGMATVELVPLLLIFVFLMSYTLGAFGIVHTAVLNSIAARNYAFETMRNRTSITYLRGLPAHFANKGLRLHGIRGEYDNSDFGFRATERNVRFGFPNEIVNRTRRDVHNQNVHEDIVPGKRNSRFGVNPVWIQVQYGMCLNVACGD